MKKEWLATWPKPHSKDFGKLGWATQLTKQEKKGIFAVLKTGGTASADGRAKVLACASGRLK